MSEAGNPWAAPEAAAWRDAQGRFRPGNPGGPGNPAAREMAALRQRLRDSVSDKIFERVVVRLAGLCLRGHLGAIKLLLEYCCGKPEKTVPEDELPLHGLRLNIEAARLLGAAAREGIDPRPDVAAAPRGRPYEEYRHAPVGRRAEPPAGGALSPDAMSALLAQLQAWGEAPRAEGGAGEGDGGRPPARSETVADTSAQRSRRNGRPAPPAGAAPGAG